LIAHNPCSGFGREEVFMRRPVRFPLSRFSSRLSYVFALSLGLVSAPGAATVPTGFTETLIANGFFSPSGMDFAADGRLFVAEQKGRIRVIRNDTMLTQQVMNLQLKVDYNVERGLQSIALDPNFLTNGYLYVYYTAKGPTTATSRNRLSRFTVVNNVADSAQETIIYELPVLPSRASFGCQNLDCNGASSGLGSTTQAVWHMGGALDFGIDGKIYLGVGEHEVTSMSQSMTSLFGKMLRLNPDGSIPTDNPFYNTATGEYRAIYALGMRNPYTMAVQPGTGRLYVADVGDVTWEEIDTIPAGGNLGWGDCEGSFLEGSTSAACPISGHVRPLFAYRHYTNNPTAQGNCAIAGDFATNFRSEDNGNFFFGDFPNTNTQTRGWIKRINPSTGGDTVTFATGVSDITGLKFSPTNGALYYITRGYQTGTIDTVDLTRGKVLKISYNNGVSILPAAKPYAKGGLLVDMGRRTLLIPTGMSALQVFDLSGRQVWSVTHLRAGETVEIPRMHAGVLKYRWTAR
jgi:glucose/arabinose dehydrogenase